MGNRRRVHYKSAKSAPKIQNRFTGRIKAVIDENPSFGHRTVAHLLDFNKNTVQRIFQLRGWLIDCYTRNSLAWRLSHSGKARAAESAREQALIGRYGTLGRVPAPFLLRSDNSLVFTSRSYTALAKSYGWKQECITSHCLEQKDMVERHLRTLRDQCVHRHRFEALQHAS